VHCGNEGAPSPGHLLVLGHRIWLTLVWLGKPQNCSASQWWPGLRSSSTPASEELPSAEETLVVEDPPASEEPGGTAS